MDEIQGSPSPCHGVDGGDSKDGETSGYSIPFLPEVRQQVTLIVDCNLNFTETYYSKRANFGEAPGGATNSSLNFMHNK